MRLNLIKKICEFNFLNKKKLNINIEYLGFINRIELFNLISNTNLYINTSYSEGCLVTAMEFLSNPFCNVILPDVKSIKDIYECERSFFYPINDVNYLLKLFQYNLDNFYDIVKTNLLFLLWKIYPREFFKVVNRSLFKFFFEI